MSAIPQSPGSLIRIFWLAAGIIALCVAVWQAALVGNLLAHGIEVPGEVAAAIDPTAELAHPLVRFTTKAGQHVTYMQNGYTARRGDGRVIVLYDPQNPAATARVYETWTFWTPVAFPLLFGAVSVGLAAGSFLMSGVAAR